MRCVTDDSGGGKNNALGTQEGREDSIRPWEPGRRD